MAAASAPGGPAPATPKPSSEVLSSESGASTAPGGAKLEFSGQLMLDAIYDFKRVDPMSNATLRPSMIPTNCPGGAGCGQNGESIFSVRQSKLALRGFFPTGLGEVKTLFDMDLFASAGGQTRARMLNAWAQVGAFGVGQYDSLFMDADIFPNTIDYWGPSGMVSVRNPQLRYTFRERDGWKVAVSLEAPGAAIDTGKVSEIDSTLAEKVAPRTRVPDLVASVRYEGDRGHVQAAGIVRRLGYHTPGSADAKPSGAKPGYGINLSGALNTVGSDRLMGALALGRGIASYMNDGGSDLAPDAAIRAQAVRSLGWLLYYDRQWSDQWSSSIGYSEHRQYNTEGQLGSAFKVGRYASVNLLFHPVSSVTTGLELLWGRLRTRDDHSGRDYRIQLSAKYTF